MPRYKRGVFVFIFGFCFEEVHGIINKKDRRGDLYGLFYLPGVRASTYENRKNVLVPKRSQL